MNARDSEVVEVRRQKLWTPGRPICAKREQEQKARENNSIEKTNERFPHFQIYFCFIIILKTVMWHSVEPRCWEGTHLLLVLRSIEWLNYLSNMKEIPLRLPSVQFTFGLFLCLYLRGLFLIFLFSSSLSVQLSLCSHLAEAFFIFNKILSFLSVFHQRYEENAHFVFLMLFLLLRKSYINFYILMYGKCIYVCKFY